MATTERLKVFDTLKLFTIFCVLWGHVVLHLQNHQFEMSENPLYRSIISFHMPLFMMISGFFCANVIGVKAHYFFKKKIRQLLLPAAMVGVVFCISWVYVCEGGNFVKNYFLCYWFLKSAFICSAFYFWATNVKHSDKAIIISLILSQLVFPFHVHLMYPSFVMGTFIMKHFQCFMVNVKLIFIISSTIFIPMLLLWSADMASLEGFRIDKTLIMRKEFNLMVVLNHLYRIIMGIFGSISFIALFILASKLIPQSKIGDNLCRWGRYTLGIYLIQAIVIEHIMMKTIDLSNMDFYVFNFLVSPILSAMVLILCLFIIRVIHKSKNMSLLILGEAKR